MHEHIGLPDDIEATDLAPARLRSSARRRCGRCGEVIGRGEAWTIAYRGQSGVEARVVVDPRCATRYIDSRSLNPRAALRLADLRAASQAMSRPER